MGLQMNKRKYELDWIRIIAILVVFLYHSTRFFNLEGWHIKNAETYRWVEIWCVFAVLWMMPIFFIISGASLYYVFEKKPGLKKYYNDKFSRLMVPLIFGVVTHSVLQIYLERITHKQFSGSFFSFLHACFSGLYLEIGGTGNFAFHGMHLWYLMLLFLFSLLCYVPFKWLAGNAKQTVTRIIDFSATPGLMILLFSIPLLLMKIFIPASILKTGSGGWGFVQYLWFLIAGFMIVSSSKIIKKIPDSRWLSLLIAVFSTLCYLYQVFSPNSFEYPLLIGPYLHSFLRYVSSWAWLMAILGFGIRHLSFDHPLLKPLNEGVMPFFILHQTVILCMGYFLMPMTIHDFFKWLIIFIGSFVIIIVSYIVVIQKFDIVRFLFGMKTSRSLVGEGRKKYLFGILHIIYAGLIFYAASHSALASNMNQAASPLIFDKKKDVLLDINSVAKMSDNGAKQVRDADTASGLAIEFAEGAISKPMPDPSSYVDMTFSAAAGSYIVWLRGKCESDDLYADSVWLQFDKQVGTGSGRMFGNWANLHPPDTWGWASDGSKAVTVILNHSGKHTLRIQPRQVPHRMDQIWLSRNQYRIPDTGAPVN